MDAFYPLNGEMTVTGGESGAGVYGDVTQYGGTLTATGGENVDTLEGGNGIRGNVTLAGGVMIAAGGNRSTAARI